VSYKAFIKKDYKPRVLWLPATPWYTRHTGTLVGITILSLVCLSVLLVFNKTSQKVTPPVVQVSLTIPASTEFHPVAMTAPINVEADVAEIETPVTSKNPEPSPWTTHKVSHGESLSVIFDRMKLSPRVLYNVMNSGDDAQLLKKLLPGDEILFNIREDVLHALKYEQNITTTLEINGEGDNYITALSVIELEKQIQQVEGVINDSLFLAGQAAGLTDNIIMRLVALYGWDIDFALNIRKGDSFKVSYEERFKNGEKVGDGPIIAAEFTNQKKVYRAVRYTSPGGDTNYYNEDGFSMRKAFLRTPVNFSRISSTFSLSRKHPVLNRIRAHKGVDYAAPTGTPIKSTGDGSVSFIGTNGGYGRMITIRHGGIYTTAYAHMSRYVSGLKKGKKVKQGDTIGYVGSSGLATGPHLHYEFRVNGSHRNPLTVQFPKAEGVPKKLMAHFKEQTYPLLAKLDIPGEREFATTEDILDKSLTLALDTTETNKPSIH
jgi:murein DD-endopeptidase MepM/ murein hydrolase activator NlpD